MSLQEIAPSPPKTLDRTVKRRITKQVRAAIDAMVWQGLKRDDAAKVAGLQDNSLYVALRRPDVKGYYLDQLEVLRTSDRARRYHRGMELAEQDDNKAAAVSALGWLERQDDQSVSAAVSRQSPGLTIIIETAPVMPHIRTIEAKPLTDNDVVPGRNGERGP